MKNSVVELVSYQLKSGVSLQQLAATHDAVNSFLNRQSGFIYRSLSQDESGQWFDIVYWQDMAAAKAAGESFMKDPAGQSLIELTEMDSVVMRHMETETEVLGENVAAA